MIKKICYIIEAFAFTSQIIIYTNYSTTTNIVKQTKLSFINTNKLNFRFVKTFIYLFQFQLNIKYKFEKQYIVSNVLFKLFFVVNNILNIIYYVIIIEIFENFKTRLKNVYRKNKR